MEMTAEQSLAQLCLHSLIRNSFTTFQVAVSGGTHHTQTLVLPQVRNMRPCVTVPVASHVDWHRPVEASMVAVGRLGLDVDRPDAS